MFILFCLPGTDSGPTILCLCALMWNLIVDFSKANLISSVAPYNIRDRHSIQPKRTTSVHSIASPLWKYRNSFERPRLVVRGGLVGDLNERLLILSDARSHVRARTHTYPRSGARYSDLISLMKLGSISGRETHSSASAIIGNNTNGGRDIRSTGIKSSGD